MTPSCPLPLKMYDLASSGNYVAVHPQGPVGSSLFEKAKAKAKANGRVKTDPVMSVSLALQLSTRMLPCWSTLVFFITAAHLKSKMISTPGSLLVRASRRLYENMANRWWISWRSFASLLPCNSNGERRPLTTTCSFVLSSRMVDGSRVTPLASFSSILEYFGVRRTA